MRLFQLGEGPAFRRSKTLSNSNLPLPPTPLLGRKKELADVLPGCCASSGARLVTVTGPGGIGQDPLRARRSGPSWSRIFAHGVWFVDTLRRSRDPGLVAADDRRRRLGAQGELAEHVGDKELLLVIDNFEQVVGAASHARRDRPRPLRTFTLLAASREPLHLSGEPRVRACGRSPSRRPSSCSASAPNAIRPNLRCAVRARTRKSADRLDRLPLAIELAASCVIVPSNRWELLRRLEQRLPLLSSRSPDRPERQRTLRATIAWSYELLGDEEQRLFARLAVFAGGGRSPRLSTCATDIDSLESLVQKSLVRFDEGRYGLLETIREYARDRLEASGEGAALARRHAEHFAALGESVRKRIPHVSDVRRAR